MGEMRIMRKHSRGGGGSLRGLRGACWEGTWRDVGVRAHGAVVISHLFASVHVALGAERMWAELPLLPRG